MERAEAGGMYPRKHVADLIRRLEAIDEKLGGAAPDRSKTPSAPRWRKNDRAQGAAQSRDSF